jgi:(2Fe-2S) ferredoxin
MKTAVKIGSVKDLNGLKEKGLDDKKKKAADKEILLCAGAGCIASGALELKAALEAALEKAGMEVPITETGCLGPCAKGPVIIVKPDNVFYEDVSKDDAQDIVGLHLLEGTVVDRLVHKNLEDGKAAPKQEDIDFFSGQTKIVLRNCGRIDPLDIEDYIGEDGYQALAKALSMDGDALIEEMKKSGLRGRGGGGFPTWLKWNFAKKAEGDIKYVLCNADEGDPGAFMDRSVLEGDPHSLIEGMAVGAHTIGASKGFIYVRAEYPLAVSRLMKALEQAREYGLLGENILGLGFDFDLEIRMGSGAFVCGEETALINSIEGKRGEPRPRPPFPANKGLWGRPSLLNNVETYANVPAIILNGAEWYASFGSEESKGTKVFALAGAINNSGLVEVPIGTPLGEVIYDIGGGILGNVSRDWSSDVCSSDLRTLRGMYPQGISQCTAGLQRAHRSRGHHGFGRAHRHGRRYLYGRRGPVLSRVRPGGVLR